jgi:hypothetical protein
VDEPLRRPLRLVVAVEGSLFPAGERHRLIELARLAEAAVSGR